MKYLIILLILAAESYAAPPVVGERDADGAIIVSVGNSPQSVVARRTVKPRVSSAQAHAQREANLMARTGRMGHLLGVAPGARFSGVGYGPTRNCNTCTPRSRMTLVADAVARGRNGYYYRSRHWR